jgi:hypothetical protein
VPLTFPSHLAPVLPLKLWRPRWFDGVALATGAVAPDVAYLAMGPDGQPFADTHTWPALFWWCLPVAVAYAWILRRVIGIAAAQLPGSRRFGWEAYGALAHTRHRWWISVISAVLGAASHIAWDWLTHTDGWLRYVFGVRWSDVTTVAWWTVSDLTSTAIGAAVVLIIAVRTGPRLAAHVTARPVTQSAVVRPRVFWATAGVVAAVGFSVTAFLPGAALPAATGVRLLHVAALALLFASLAVRTSVRPNRRTGNEKKSTTMSGGRRRSRASRAGRAHPRGGRC